jgi:hypothetical protein
MEEALRVLAERDFASPEAGSDFSNARLACKAMRCSFGNRKRAVLRSFEDLESALGVWETGFGARLREVSLNVHEDKRMRSLQGNMLMGRLFGLLESGKVSADNLKVEVSVCGERCGCCPEEAKPELFTEVMLYNVVVGLDMSRFSALETLSLDIDGGAFSGLELALDASPVNLRHLKFSGEPLSSGISDSRTIDLRPFDALRSVELENLTLRTTSLVLVFGDGNSDLESIRVIGSPCERLDIVLGDRMRGVDVFAEAPTTAIRVGNFARCVKSFVSTCKYVGEIEASERWLRLGGSIERFDVNSAWMFGIDVGDAERLRVFRTNLYALREHAMPINLPSLEDTNVPVEHLHARVPSTASGVGLSSVRGFPGLRLDVLRSLHLSAFDACRDTLDVSSAAALKFLEIKAMKSLRRLVCPASLSFLYLRGSNMRADRNVTVEGVAGDLEVCLYDCKLSKLGFNPVPSGKLVVNKSRSSAAVEGEASVRDLGKDERSLDRAVREFKRSMGV